MVINEEELKKVTHATIVGVVKGVEQAASMQFLKDMHKILKSLEEKYPGATVAQICKSIEDTLEDSEFLHDTH